MTFPGSSVQPGGGDGLASCTGLATVKFPLGYAFKRIALVSSPNLSVGTGQRRSIIVFCSTNYMDLFECLH